MWSRQELKSRAKTALKQYYWIAFVVCLVATLLGGSGGGGGGSSLGNNINNNIQNDSSYGDINLDPFITGILPFIIGLIVLIVIIAIIYSIFVAGPIEVGTKYFFLSSRENSAQFTSMFSNFRKGRYLNTVKTIFFRNLYTLLWSLLLIIPGIIKGYEYRMISYIMAENPNIDTNRAFEISKYMTDGEKFNMFVLDLSFLGWYLLGAIPCGLGIFFVNPYYEATLAELYTVKREEVIRSGFSNELELCGFTNSTPNNI